MSTIDFSAVARLIEEAEKVVSIYDGTTVDDLDRRNSSVAASASRQLLHLSDILTLAGALVRNEYWAVKGFADLIKEETS